MHLVKKVSKKGIHKRTIYSYFLLHVTLWEELRKRNSYFAEI